MSFAYEVPQTMLLTLSACVLVIIAFVDKCMIARYMYNVQKYVYRHYMCDTLFVWDIAYQTRAL